MSQMTIFECVQMNFVYPHSQENILNNLNLKITQGEAVSILGANGCGKSTLLKIFAGLISPTTGEFKAFGQTISEQLLNQDKFSLNYHRQIGFIFQDSEVQLFCNSVYDELAFGLLQLNLATDIIKQRIRQISELFAIEHLLTKVPYRLSGGEKKKVALAAVLLLNPSVIILDEPSNALDPKTQRWLIDLLKQLHQIGKTIIISSHNLQLVESITMRSLLFNEQHQIVADLTTEQLFKQTELLKQVNLI
jgi:cobalt/nickel transport system ATP-binding protein